MPTPSVTSSSSPTPSTVSRATTQNMTSIKETLSENDAVFPGQKDFLDLRSVYGAETIYEDSDDEELLASSGDGSDEKSVGLFDVVKREFRVKTAVITNKPDFEHIPRKPKGNFIQDMKTKVGIALEHKNKGMEEVQNKDLKQATRHFHLALLHVKGLDPDEGVLWNLDFESMDKDKMPLRMMPSELKEIKEGLEIDCYLGLAGKKQIPHSINTVSLLCCRCRLIRRRLPARPISLQVEYHFIGIVLNPLSNIS